MKLLKKALNTTAVCALTAAMAFSLTTTVKAEDAGTNITATVANAITWVETTPLAFGTIVAINHTADLATMTVDTAGVSSTTGTANAKVIEVVAAQQGVFDASSAAPSTTLALTLPTSVTLACGACGAGTEDFTVDTFTDDAAGAPITSAGGAVTVNVGATLRTIPHATNVYNDGLYQGAYTVSINY